MMSIADQMANLPPGTVSKGIIPKSQTGLDFDALVVKKDMTEGRYYAVYRIDEHSKPTLIDHVFYCL